MTDFDIIIIGAGPAGGQCARQLAKQHRVLIVDQVKTFADNDYSSAGTVYDFLADFDIPPSAVGTAWQTLTIYSDHHRYEWPTDQPQGVVLDFAKLKQFLVDEAKAHQAQVRLGHKYRSHTLLPDNTLSVTLFDRHNKQPKTVTTRCLVDASGSARVAIGQRNHPNYLHMIGQEYLIQCEQSHDDMEDRLVFMLGKTWIDRGYAWIFPMGNAQYKVGAATFYPETDKVTFNVRSHVEAVLKKCFQDRSYHVLDKHGGDVFYCHPKKQVFYDKGVVVVGDGVSAINALGGEGIRHGMVSADLAAQAITQFLTTKNPKVFKRYRKQFLKYIGYKWWICETYAKRYYNFDKTDTDALFKRLQSKPYSMMKALLFDYDFPKIIRRYSKHKLKYLLKLFV